MTHLKLQKLKKWYYSTAHWHLGDVLVGNHLFLIFAVLDVSFAVNSSLNRSFFTFISTRGTSPWTECRPWYQLEVRRLQAVISTRGTSPWTECRSWYQLEVRRLQAVISTRGMSPWTECRPCRSPVCVPARTTTVHGMSPELWTPAALTPWTSSLLSCYQPRCVHRRQTFHSDRQQSVVYTVYRTILFLARSSCHC